jgi:hypothetical protein
MKDLLAIILGISLGGFMASLLVPVNEIEKEERQLAFIEESAQSLNFKVSEQIIEYKKLGINLVCENRGKDNQYYYVICNYE